MLSAKTDLFDRTPDTAKLTPLKLEKKVLLNWLNSHSNIRLSPQTEKLLIVLYESKSGVVSAAEIRRRLRAEATNAVPVELEKPVRNLNNMLSLCFNLDKGAPPLVQSSYVGAAKAYKLDFSRLQMLIFESDIPPWCKKIPTGGDGEFKLLWLHALDTFGSSARATEWFQTACGDLENRAPIDLLSDNSGKQEVDRILGCIDHGMIA